MYTYFGDQLGTGSDHICICTQMYFEDLHMHICLAHTFIWETS